MPEENERLRALEALRDAAQGLSDATRERDVLDVLLTKVRDVLPAKRFGRVDGGRAARGDEARAAPSRIHLVPFR